MTEQLPFPLPLTYHVVLVSGGQKVIEIYVAIHTYVKSFLDSFPL